MKVIPAIHASQLAPLTHLLQEAGAPVEHLLESESIFPGILETFSEFIPAQRVFNFMDRAEAQGCPVVQWRIEFDPRGDPHGDNLGKHRCKHVNQLRVTHVPGEHELLFQAYSTFSVKSVQWSTVTPATAANPHHITLVPAIDNAQESNELPLAPWY